MEGKSPAASASHHEHLVRPQHTNAHGTLFGGEVMAWVDIAAAVTAMRHCEKSVVTASIDALHFLAPIHLGWIVCLDSSVNFTSRTSCEIGVRVTAFSPITKELHHTASAYLTFVAIDSNGRPAEIPQIVPDTEKDRERFDAAQERRKGRLELKEKLTSKKKKKS